jgi:hypothetical protein
MHPADSNHVYILADVPRGLDTNGARAIAYETLDAGRTFTEMEIADIPATHSTTNPCESVLYVVGPQWSEYQSGDQPQMLLRSTNGGYTWHDTAYLGFIERLRDECESRTRAEAERDFVPLNELGVYLTFIILCGCYGLLMLVLGRHMGWPRLIVSMAKSTALAVLFCVVISRAQHHRYWLVMADRDFFGPLVLGALYITCQPWALCLWFLVFACFLPTTIDCVRFKEGKWKPKDNSLLVSWDLLAVAMWLLIGVALWQLWVGTLG